MKRHRPTPTALTTHRFDDEAMQRMAAKAPSWARQPDLHYPSRLALEQCSGEAAARYKARLAAHLIPPTRRRSMADLTGGLGVDFSRMAPLFATAHYVERNPDLCQAAAHNFPLLGLQSATIACGEAAEVMESLPPQTLIYLDPARRDALGRKTVRIEDCTPNVADLLPRLREKAEWVMVKLSPMLDISLALRSLAGAVQRVDIVGAGGECKELLLTIGPQTAEAVAADNPLIVVGEGEEGPAFSFRPSEEREAQAPLSDSLPPGHYLYEPSPAMLKSGCFKLMAQRFGLHKLADATHLYTSPQRLDHFPGRCMEITAVSGFDKAALSRLRTTTERANLTLRNFPGTTDSLRKKLRLKDGGALYLFATTMADGSHRLIHTRYPERPAT